MSKTKNNIITDKFSELSDKPLAAKILAATGGVLITLALIFTMHLLIAMGDPELNESEAFVMPKFVNVPEQIDPNTIQAPEKPPEVPEKPDVPEPEIQPQVNVADVKVNIGATVSINTDIGSILNPSDGEYLPIVKIAPVYPARAAERCLEGYVIVKFTVNTSGAVENPVVVESSSSVFENSAKSAAKKFKYKPRMSEGSPVPVTGVTNKITFRMDKSAC